MMAIWSRDAHIKFFGCFKYLSLGTRASSDFCRLMLGLPVQPLSMLEDLFILLQLYFCFELSSMVVSIPFCFFSELVLSTPVVKRSD